MAGSGQHESNQTGGAAVRGRLCTGRMRQRRRPTSSTSPAPVQAAARNVIFFLGDGMGITTLTAARIYAVGEDGALTIDTLPETAFVKTYSNDAQVTAHRRCRRT